MMYVPYRQQEAPDLFEWLCIEELRLCCLPGRFGPDCKGVKIHKALNSFLIRIENLTMPNLIYPWFYNVKNDLDLIKMYKSPC